MLFVSCFRSSQNLFICFFFIIHILIPFHLIFIPDYPPDPTVSSLSRMRMRNGPSLKLLPGLLLLLSLLSLLLLTSHDVILFREEELMRQEEESKRGHRGENHWQHRKSHLILFLFISFPYLIVYYFVLNVVKSLFRLLLQFLSENLTFLTKISV